MTANYEIHLTTDAGVRIALLDNFVRLEASRIDGRAGDFFLQMPVSFDPDLLVPDRLIQVWRQPEGGRLKLWNVYLLREWEFSTRGSDHIVELSGPDMKDLLWRRIVAAYSKSAQANKTDFADDMMKEVVTESIADGVAPTPDAGTRVWANLSIAADVNAGPTITQEFPFDYLLTDGGGGVLPTLKKAAKEAGTEVFFDIVPNVISENSITFQFRTYIGQPGQDVSSKVIFDEAAGNLKDPKLNYNYRKEKNYIYATGQSYGSQRTVTQVYDSNRYGQSIWARCEGTADARNQTGNGVREAGRDALNNGRPRIQYSATPADTEGTRFGIDWDFGYKVRSKYLNREFDCIIRAVALTVENGKETISKARLDYESAI